MQMGYKWELRPDKKDEFYNRMKPYVSWLDSRDVLDLPKETHINRLFPLSVDEYKFYKEMELDMVATLKQSDPENNQVAIDTALGKLIKLRQITSGFIYRENDKGKREIISLGDSKLKELLDLLEDIGPKQVIIWICFEEEAAMISQALSKTEHTYGTFTAKTNDKTKTDEMFRAGKIQYLIANPQCAAHGFTWINCQYEVFYSMNYSYEDYHQSIKRILRKGQEKPCFYFYLIAEQTKDNDILSCIKRKEGLQQISKLFLGEAENGN